MSALRNPTFEWQFTAKVIFNHAVEGDELTGRTWVGEAPQGARFDRFVEFVNADGKISVRARTHWAIIDKASGRPIRVPPEVVAPFLT